MEQDCLVWIDCEMTGLDVEKDTILEIATIITDSSLVIIEEGPSCVIYYPELKLNEMDPVVYNLHKQSGLFDAVIRSNITLQEAEQKTLDFIKRHCKQRGSPLCGNSVWQDRIFLARYMPSIINYLHYRIIDVSSIKELLKRWYPDDSHLHFKKQNTHRALDDIKESIAELQHYRNYFFV